MTAKTYWALSVKDSAQYAHAKDAQINAQKAAKEHVQEFIKCDGVFISTTGSVYLGYKTKPDLPDLKKKPDGDHEGFALYTARSKTLTADILAEARKKASSAVNFNDFCRTLWTQSVREVMGSGNRPHSFTLTRTSFSWLSDRVVMMLPFSDEEPIDTSIVPPGFVELTVSQYAELSR